MEIPQIRGCWIGGSLPKKKFCSQVFAFILIVTGFTTSCCQCIGNFEFKLIGIKFKFYRTITDRGLQFNISGSDSLDSIAVLGMKLIIK